MKKSDFERACDRVKDFSDMQLAAMMSGVVEAFDQETMDGLTEKQRVSLMAVAVVGWTLANR